MLSKSSLNRQVALLHDITIKLENEAKKSNYDMESIRELIEIANKLTVIVSYKIQENE